MANPWIFRQVEEAIAGREIYQPTLEDKRAVLLEYFEMLREDMPELPAIGKMKQLAGQFTRGLQGGAVFRTSIYHSHSVEEILDRIAEYFEAVAAGRKYREDETAEIEAAPVLDSCEAATAAS
jgi:tRNA-dihydrouridine synthase